MHQQAIQIIVQGIVQGVGFRPFVYRLAWKMQLRGTVANSSNGVVIELQGTKKAIATFCSRLQNEPPPISRITSITIKEISVQKQRSEFIILPSLQAEKANTQISPDIGLCSDCIRELFDRRDRRYRYPFINCTNCGPRFSIIKTIPYDRPNTSMDVFTLCPQCEREYHDPLNRRFHAQPNACPTCGPSLSWHDEDGHLIAASDCIGDCAKALKAGKVVAIKGLGGFHLAVDATSISAVATLRERKHRKEKPLAIMVRDLEQAREYCLISEQEGELLSSHRAPIVLVEKQNNTIPAENLAPGIGILGLMLPYTPLHHLLLADPNCPPALVMTSGNLSGEPICTGNDEALARLHGLADYFLLHNREIVTRVDDSVVRIMGGKARMLRRARGYTPEPLLLAHQTKNVLGCGAEMKNSFCIVRNNEAFISQHIGELTNPQALDFYTESINHFQNILETDFQIVTCDLHPDYLSTRFCEKLPQPCKQVQHHHAHGAAVMAEHGLDGPVLAVIFDGTGYSDDGTVYGGEWYLADRRGYTRLAHLSLLPLPGGDVAAGEPWRMAMAMLYMAAGTNALDRQRLPEALLQIDTGKRTVITQMMTQKINCPLTSSCGRIFDAVAGLLGLCLMADYEGQAAMQLEHQAAMAGVDQRTNRYNPALEDKEGVLILDSRPLILQIVEDLQQDVAIPVIAYGFHQWLLDGSIEILRQLRQQTGLDTIVLGGGSFQNKLLLEGITTGCIDGGFSVFSSEQVPAGDGGIALGQAYAAMQG